MRSWASRVLVLIAAAFMLTACGGGGNGGGDNGSSVDDGPTPTPNPPADEREPSLNGPASRFAPATDVVDAVAKE